MPPPVPRCSRWEYSSLISPDRISLPRYGGRVGLHIVLFEACSAFTRVAACPLAQSPIVTARAVFPSVWKRVTAMVEPPACVSGGDAVEGGGEGGFERLAGARLGGPRGAFELGPAGF